MGKKQQISFVSNLTGDICVARCFSVSLWATEMDVLTRAGGKSRQMIDLTFS